MKGLWKESLSGWNHKDSKRKKTNRNHTIKDNIKNLHRIHFRNDIINKNIHFEGNSNIITYNKIEKKTTIVNICVVEFINNINKEIKDPFVRDYSSSIKEAYKSNYDWKDIYTNELIKYDSFKVLAKLDDYFVINNDNELIIKSYTNHFVGTKKTMYLYDKPLYKKWFKIYGFRACGRRKHSQKFANRKTRAKTKDWIRKKDYEMSLEIKTHKLQKTIAWDVW